MEALAELLRDPYNIRLSESDSELASRSGSAMNDREQISPSEKTFRKFSSFEEQEVWNRFARSK